MKPDKHNDLETRLSRLYQAADVPEGFETAWRADIRREESIQTMKKNSNVTRILKRLAPAMCALVMVLGGLWAGTLDLNGTNPMESTNQTAFTTRSANSAAPKLSMSYDSAVYEEAAEYDMGVASNGAITTYGAQPQTERKLVRTADLTIRTDVYDDALAAVQKTLADMGGYIENLYQYGENARRISLTMRVPSDRLDEFLGGVEGLGRVTDRSEYTTDMTVEYYDNQARLETLYQKRDRLNELLLQAQSVSDLIEIESAIADTQYQIDRYETSQRSIDRQVDMSMVTLTLVEQEQTVVNKELTLGERIAVGFKASIEWLGNFARNVIVFAVIIAPAAAVVAVVWGVWRVVRRVRRQKTKEE